jgi:hypothetical protein
MKEADEDAAHFVISASLHVKMQQHFCHDLPSVQLCYQISVTPYCGVYHLEIGPQGSIVALGSLSCSLLKSDHVSFSNLPARLGVSSHVSLQLGNFAHCMIFLSLPTHRLSPTVCRLCGLSQHQTLHCQERKRMSNFQIASISLDHST